LPTIPKITYARVFDLAFFDGTNADDLLALVQESYPSASAMGGTPGVTTIIRTDIPDNGGYTFTFRVGDAWEKDQGLGYYQYESVAQSGYARPLAEFIQDVLADQVPDFAAGYAAIPALDIGASATLSVPIRPQLPSASGYTPLATMAGVQSLLADLEVYGTPSMVGGSACSVSVRNTGGSVLGTGATVMVHCMKS
jgi:hypothetical protein